jgi:hypothetical protein
LIERQTVEFAKRVDFVPVLANVGVLQGNVVRPIGAQTGSAPTRIKALTLHHKLGNAGNGFADPPRFLCGEFAGAETVSLRLVAAIEPRHGHAAGVLDGVALGILPDQGPGRLETAD